MNNVDEKCSGIYRRGKKPGLRQSEVHSLLMAWDIK